MTISLTLLLAFGALHANELKFGRDHDLANKLVFYFNSQDLILTPKLLESRLEDSESPEARVFRRILNNRKSKSQKNTYLNKRAIAPSQGEILFSSFEIQQAAADEILSLGEGAFKALVECVNSARKNIRLGVLKCLLHRKDDRLLKVYQQVLLRDRWGGTKFSSHARQWVAFGLWRYKDSESGLQLLKKTLKDKDPFVRAALLKSIDQIPEKLKKVISHELVLALQKEMSDLEDRVAALKKEEGDSALKNNPLVLIPLSKILDRCLSLNPEILNEVKLSPFVLKQGIVGRVLLTYDSQLPKGMRGAILTEIFKNSKDFSTLVSALRVLKKNDREDFKGLIQGFIQNSKDAQVLKICLELAELWSLKSSRIEITRVSKEDFRLTIRTLASRVAATL